MRRIPNLKTKGDGEFEVGARRRAVAAGRANRARRQILKNLKHEIISKFHILSPFLEYLLIHRCLNLFFPNS